MQFIAFNDDYRPFCLNVYTDKNFKGLPLLVGHVSLAGVPLLDVTKFIDYEGSAHDELEAFCELAWEDFALLLRKALTGE